MRDDKAFIKIEVTERNGDKTYGTAYRINSEHAITALHVINDQQPKKFIFPCGTEGNDSEEVFTCNDSDVAIIKFPAAIIDTLAVPSAAVGAAAESAAAGKPCLGFWLLSVVEIQQRCFLTCDEVPVYQRWSVEVCIPKQELGNELTSYSRLVTRPCLVTLCRLYLAISCSQTPVWKHRSGSSSFLCI